MLGERFGNESRKIGGGIQLHFSYERKRNALVLGRSPFAIAGAASVKKAKILHLQKEELIAQPGILQMRKRKI